MMDDLLARESRAARRGTKPARATSAVPAPIVPAQFTEYDTAITSRLTSRIDAALARLAGRQTVPAREMADLLLDLRSEILIDARLAEILDAAHVPT